ncbi:forkhead box protein N2-like [Coccinella septempunctata]|uniref:forkhead box protein N2-like n=1 Tax=Coccinella septempunctata TaxID=41139 RepID=UPI001D07D264|nr:forkhead box protein N2-like [Coccinella septempunctata]XP_044748327.1 forkhead box protein N2-like [Coccinella septempunctata]
MSPERIGSPHDDQVATPKMSVPASPVAGTPACEAQNPISLLLAVAQAQSSTRSPDDDLTSLSWLHEKDLLKGMNINPSPSNSTNSTPKQYYALSHILPDQSPTSDYVEDSSISPGESSNSSLNSSFPTCHNYQNNQQKNKHPHNVPYDPMVHTNNKPPYSFSCLIFMAIEESPQKALPVKEIYSWILSHFPYFQNAPTGWKNSVRHNLSLNKCFQKVEKAPNLGKGSLWTVDPQYKPNLIQALTRSPFHPCSNLDTSSYLNNNIKTKDDKVEKKSPQSISRLPDPQLFPYLSKTLASVEMSTPVKTEYSDDSLDEVDAATVMLSLKNGPTMRQKRKNVWQVVTTLPSQDHTYSAANSSMSAESEEAFENDDARPKKSTSCQKIDNKDEEEEKKIKGAEILLHFAGVTRTRTYYEPSRKRMRALTFESEEDVDEKQVPFKPRLLRTKRKETKQKYVNNNNNNEWVKHRKELETSSSKRYIRIIKINIKQ